MLRVAFAEPPEPAECRPPQALLPSSTFSSAQWGLGKLEFVQTFHDSTPVIIKAFDDFGWNLPFTSAACWALLGVSQEGNASLLLSA